MRNSSGPCDRGSSHNRRPRRGRRRFRFGTGAVSGTWQISSLCDSCRASEGGVVRTPLGGVARSALRGSARQTLLGGLGEGPVPILVEVLVRSLPRQVIEQIGGE